METQEQILTAEEVRKLGRPIGQVDALQLNAYIKEAEQMYVKPLVGDKLYLDILKNEDDKYDTLLNGGTYTDGSEEIHSFMGLKVALSYFVYAQNIMTGDFQSTRYGMVLKDNDYSQHLSGKERSDAYNNALEVGNMYLSECVAYCKTVGFIQNKGKIRGTGSLRIKKIG